jgi:arabinofuranosyltransferase
MVNKPKRDRSTNTESLFWWSCVTIAVIVTAVHSWQIRPWMLDDSFISFRYADNMARGFGPVYNIGERVEGYTSFLWVVLLGLGKRLGCDTVVLSQVLSSVFAGLTLLLIAFSHRIVSSITRPVAAMAVLFVGTCALFTSWLTSGMEVSLFTFLALVTIMLYRADLAKWPPVVRMALSGLAAGLAMMTRPEGVLIAAVLVIHGGYQFFRYKERSVLAFAATALAVYLPYFIWRYSYYGFLLPNTFYDKVGSTTSQLVRGVSYSLSAIESCVPLILLALFLLVRPSAKDRLLPILLLSCCGLQLVYIVMVGGDCMPAFRFFAPIVPLMALAAALGAGSVSRRWGILILFAVIVGGNNLAQMAYSPKIAGLIQADKVALRGKAVGVWLKGHVPPGTLLATNTAGSVAYYSDLPIVDMLGLNDLHIAHQETPNIGSGLAGHEKGDGAYVLSRHPVIVQLGSSMGSGGPVFRGDSGIYISEEFKTVYSPVRVPMPELGGSAMFYVRGNFHFHSQ